MISTTSLPFSLTLLLLSSTLRLELASALPDSFSWHAARASKLNLWPAQVSDASSSHGALQSAQSAQGAPWDASWDVPSAGDLELAEFTRRANANAGINFNPNGSAFLWLPSDEYSGSTFFDRWSFFTDADPTSGLVQYVDKETAIANGFINATDGQPVMMKADNTNTLPMGQPRQSVRITSTTSYTTGTLLILDLNRAPWGCAVWPAFWTTGPHWPDNGEIDILEGVHDNQHNQIAWHTAPGCWLDPSAEFTGTIPNDNGVNRTNCDKNYMQNSGCDVVEWSQASYGPDFEAQGGGILAMKWDENDISVWSFFRRAIPTDVTAGTPNPSLWGRPSAKLMNTTCNLGQYFANHNIVFDITFCGDWAGNSYATSGCPGTCPERLMDPTNFENATWSINSLKVYRKQLIKGNSTTLASGGSMTRRGAKAGLNLSTVLFVTVAAVLLALL